jgi:hypothetical protein
VSRSGGEHSLENLTRPLRLRGSHHLAGALVKNERVVWHDGGSLGPQSVRFGVTPLDQQTLELSHKRHNLLFGGSFRGSGL